MSKHYRKPIKVDSENRKYIFDLSNKSISYLRYVSIFIASSITFLSFGNYDIVEEINTINYRIILKFSLIILYSSITYGVLKDIREFQRNFHDGLYTSKFPALGIFLLVITGASFLLMCNSINNFKYFIVYNSFFWLFNYYFWCQIKEFTIAIFKESYKNEIYTHNRVGQFRIKYIFKYYFTKWYEDRFNYAIGFILLISFIIFFLESPIKDIGFDDHKVFASVIYLIFILFMETWIWVKRTKRRYLIKTIEELTHNYNLIRKYKRK